MSGTGSGETPGATAKLQDHDRKKTDPAAGASASAPPNPPPAMLEEDDEFEDFPVEGRSYTGRSNPPVGSCRTWAKGNSPDWPQEEAEGPSSTTQTAAGTGSTHLWEESWDDDEDGSEEFSKQLKYATFPPSSPAGAA